ncbi:MAG TPA: hypothetical protein VL501_04600 [Pyrinomonadaceae bacterium]|nr:hypothetical protein [Pyrinomonadaceae bacterium]
MVSDEIHHSIADADDIEEVRDVEIHVGDVFSNVLRHPLQLITRWNWKAVLLAVIVRAAIYLVVYTLSGEGTVTILTAVVFEAITRFLTTGVAGALVQSFRKAQPIWLANLIVSVLLPAFSHTVEFLTHYIQERYYSDMFAASQNSARQKTFPISVLFSVVSVLFNLYAMRNGALLVGAGEETQTLRKDFTQIPALIRDFVGALPNMICRYIERGKIINALFAIVTFGFTVGAILGTTRWKLKWGINSALGAWGVIIFATIVCLIGRRMMGINGRNQSHVR